MPLPLFLALVAVQGQANPPTTPIVVKPIPKTQGTAPTSTVTTPPPPPAQPPAVQPAVQPFSTPFMIAEQNRIALTPKFDGRLDTEEWDPLNRSGDMQSFFEWEPGKL